MPHSPRLEEKTHVVNLIVLCLSGGVPKAVLRANWLDMLTAVCRLSACQMDEDRYANSVRETRRLDKVLTSRQAMRRPSSNILGG